MIYTPRQVIDRFVSICKRGGTLDNPATCTKILYRDCEISIAMDSSHGPGDLDRTDIRVYTTDKDITNEVIAANPALNGQCMIYGTGEQLRAVFKAIDRIKDKK